MRVLVCGGRDYADFDAVRITLDELRVSKGVTVVIHGGASGADTLAGEWAALRGIPVEVFRADWKANGRAAGPIRNAKMLREGKPDWCIAFPGGRGTADMAYRCRQAGVPTTVFGDADGS